MGEPAAPKDRRHLGSLFVSALVVVVALTLLVALGRNRQGDASSDPEVASGPGSAVGTPRSADWPTPPPASGPSDPLGTPPAGPIVLRSGATMAPPTGGTPINPPGGIPAEVSRSNRAFRLPGGNRRLMVSEMELGGQACGARLDQEWARMERSKTMPDAGGTDLRRVTTTDDRQIAGRRVLWGESMQGTSLVDAGAPFAATATALTCAGESLVLVMYMATEPTLDASVRPTIEAMLTSLRLPPAP